MVETKRKALHFPGSAGRLEFFEPRFAVPDLASDSGAVELDPVLGAGQRMQKSLEVNLPAASLEIEIVLTITGIWLGRTGVLAH